MKTIRPPFVIAAAIRRLRAVAVLALPAAVLVSSGCESPVDPGPTTNPWENFQGSDFDANSANITNAWMGFDQVGRQFVYVGTSVDEGVDVPHRVEINVMHLTKLISGTDAQGVPFSVNCRVTYDLDYQNGILVEAENAFYAQDRSGNVWRMGEYPEEYEDGEFAAAPTWIGGIAGAIPGISMRANPTLGSPSYSQGWGPGVGFTDRGVVDAVGLDYTGPMGMFTDVLRIAESAEGEAGEQLKYWHQAKNGLPAGNVHVNFRGEGEQTREFLDLIEVNDLDATQLRDLCIGAFALEASAYEKSPGVYGHTLPMQTPQGDQICR